jgi:hypothetical protein
MFPFAKENGMNPKYLLPLLAVLAIGPARAHDDATLDALPSPHGGQVRMAGAYHFELVLDRAAGGGKPARVQVHLSDHGGQAVAAQGVSGSVTLLGPGGKSSIRLAPDGPSSLAGSGVYQADPALKAVVSLTFPGGQVELARFEPFKSAGPSAVNAR